MAGNQVYNEYFWISVWFWIISEHCLTHRLLWNYFSGEGLGKNSQGISEPIKASLKFDKTGVGHDPAKEFTSSWWDDAYKQAANNVIIDSEQVANSGIISSSAIL